MRRTSHLFTIPLAALLVAACGSSKTTTVTSHAYGHHDTDKADTANFVSVYPNTVGTRLDSCQTCHKSFVFSKVKSTGTQYTPKSVCDYCHMVKWPDMNTDGTIKLYDNAAQPTSIADTLNVYGVAYRDSGKTPQALRDIAGQDTDGDGHRNADEIAAGRYPGDPNSNPALQFGPRQIKTVAEVQAMPVHSEFLLSNSQKQKYDNYALYKGVKITEFLAAMGLDPHDARITGVTVIAPDGFTTTFPRQEAVTVDSEQYWYDAAFPPGQFYGGLDTSEPPSGLGTSCGFVEYPNPIPVDRIGPDGITIQDEQWLLLAYERDGLALDTAYIDPANLRLNGEGPLRLIVPQKMPGKPDRGSQASPTNCGDGYDWDQYGGLDHNAGSAVRGVMAIRIDAVEGAMPAYEEFDYQNGGYDYLARGELVVFGYGIQ